MLMETLESQYGTDRFEDARQQARKFVWGILRSRRFPAPYVLSNEGGLESMTLNATAFALYAETIETGLRQYSQWLNANYDPRKLRRETSAWLTYLEHNLPREKEGEESPAATAFGPSLGEQPSGGDPSGASPFSVSARHLSDYQRKVLLTWLDLRQSEEATAEALGLTVGQVNSALRHARRKLRCLADALPTDSGKAAVLQVVFDQ